MENTLKRTDISYLRIMQYVVFGSIILHFGQDVFVPLSLALLIRFVLYPIVTWMERKGVPRMAAILLGVFALLLLLLALVFLLLNQLLAFLGELTLILDQVAELLNHYGGC